MENPNHVYIKKIWNSIRKTEHAPYDKAERENQPDRCVFSVVYRAKLLFFFLKNNTFELCFLNIFLFSNCPAFFSVFTRRSS